jgi:hypothetical protein
MNLNQIETKIIMKFLCIALYYGHPTIWKIKIKYAVSTRFMTWCLPEFLPSSLSNMYHNTSNSRTFDLSKLQIKSRTMQCKGQQHFICLDVTRENNFHVKHPYHWFLQLRINIMKRKWISVNNHLPPSQLKYWRKRRSG